MTKIKNQKIPASLPTPAEIGFKNIKKRNEERMMLDKKQKLDLKRSIENDKRFHYMITDRYRQDVDYLIRIEAFDSARESFELVEYLLSLFKEKDIPEWFTNEDLEKQRKILFKNQKSA